MGVFGEADDGLHHFQGGGGLGEAEVECLPFDLGVADALGRQQISPHGILYVHEVAAEEAVGADDRPFVAEDAADRAGDKAVPVEVAAAVEVGAAGYGDRQTVGVGVALGDQVGAAFRHIVGV